MRKKVAAIAATGAFASVFTYAVANGLGAALHAKQFFMPIAMTFVLVLGIPSSGGTVNSDMLQGFIGASSDG